MSALPTYSDAEGEALVYPSGHSPAYFWSADHDEWRKARVGSNGGLLVSSETTESSVVDHTTSAQTLFTGAALLLPITILTSAKYLIAGAALGAKVAFSWRT